MVTLGNANHLARLTSDFAQNITDILEGKEPDHLTDKGVTLGVVVASNGYPLAYEKGVKLPAKTEGDIITYYAGAKFAENGQDLLSNGGRVYMLVTTADTVKDGQNIIYNELNKQNTEGLFYRTDIGSKANKQSEAPFENLRDCVFLMNLSLYLRRFDLSPLLEKLLAMLVANLDNRRVVELLEAELL